MTKELSCVARKDIPTLFDAMFKNTVGFDDVFTHLFDEFLPRVAKSDHYPPYNIKKIDEENYVIEMAVAGYSPDDLEITVEEGPTLVVKGKQEETGESYVHRGIASRRFERRFALAGDNTNVVGEAELKNGILSIKINVPKPKLPEPTKIEIKT